MRATTSITGRTRYERTHRPHRGAQRRAPVSCVPVDRSIMLNADALKRIDREIAKYPPERRQSAVMATLAIAQDEHAWLSTETMDFVAHYLGMPPIAVYEVATFYEMFNTEPTGKYKLTICTNLPCALSSAAQAAAHLKQK